MQNRMKLEEYIYTEVLPRYDAFDAAHRRDHALMVMQQSAEIASHYDVDAQMVMTIAAFHDVGLAFGREHHHLESGRIIREDAQLREWFTPEQIAVMAEAAEDHRASADHAPRSIYGRIVAEADRMIDPVTIIRRTVQFGLAHYPELSREEHFRRAVEHLHEKYGEGGYLRLWIEDSPNARRLRELRAVIADEARLQAALDEAWAAEFLCNG